MLFEVSAPPENEVEEVAFVAPAAAPAGADPKPWLPGRFSPLADWVYSDGQLKSGGTASGRTLFEWLALVLTSRYFDKYILSASA
jgi:hypothetical protein